MLDAYEEEYKAGADRKFPVSVINDLYDAWEGTVRLRILRDGGTVAEKVLPCKTPAPGATRLSIALKIPAKLANYQLETALVKQGASPVCSVRDFKAVTNVKTR